MSISLGFLWISRKVTFRCISYTSSVCFHEFFVTAKRPAGTAPEFTRLMEDVTFVEGKSATLECEVKGEPLPVIEWFRDGEQVKESKRVKLEFDGKVCSLIFKPIELDDEGEYKCVALNELGSSSTKAELLVDEAESAPEFIEKLKDIVVQAGDEVKFDVRVIGVPPPEVDWYKGNEVLEDEGRFIMVDDIQKDLFTLIIEEAQPQDSGEYKCVAFSELGEVSCKGNLVVEGEAISPQLASDTESAAPIYEEQLTIAPDVAELGESSPVQVSDITGLCMFSDWSCC